MIRHKRSAWTSWSDKRGAHGLHDQTEEECMDSMIPHKRIAWTSWSTTRGVHGLHDQTQEECMDF